MKDKIGQFDFRGFGQTIKRARNDRGWTREQLGGMLGITPRYLVDIENEGQHPSLQVLYSLVTLFDISVDQFIFPQREAAKTTQRYGAYLRKMAIDGYIIYTDTANIKDFTKVLQGIGRNFKQIARRLNSGAPVYEADIAEIKERLGQIWQLQRHILLSLR